MKLEFLSTDDDTTWSEFVSRVPHDFYHLAGYARLAEQTDGGHAEAVLIAEGSEYFFLPYVLRPLSELDWLGERSEDLYDFCSPYGYPGPLVGCESEGFLREALDLWIRAMQERNVVSGFVRLHPLLDTPIEQLALWGDVVDRGQTVSIDLLQPVEELWRQTRRDHRRNINQSLRAGMTTEVVPAEEHLAEFTELYYETMDRVGAGEYFYFSPDYFRRLIRILGKQLSLCMVKDSGQNVLCGGLFSECDGIVQYHLSGTRTEALRLRPSKLMIHAIRQWATERGNRVMHLGGGAAGQQGSLFDFKAGFSHGRHNAATWHLVVSPEKYTHLDGQRRSLDESSEDANFFPGYRRILQAVPG